MKRLNFNGRNFNIFSVEGEVILLLCHSPLSATKIYSKVNASTPTVSRAIKELIYNNIIDFEKTPYDQRIVLYKIKSEFKKSLSDYFLCLEKIFLEI